MINLGTATERRVDCGTWGSVLTGSGTTSPTFWFGSAIEIRICMVERRTGRGCGWTFGAGGAAPSLLGIFKGLAAVSKRDKARRVFVDAVFDVGFKSSAATLDLAFTFSFSGWTVLMELRKGAVLVC